MTTRTTTPMTTARHLWRMPSLRRRHEQSVDTVAVDWQLECKRRYIDATRLYVHTRVAMLINTMLHLK